MNGIKVDPFHDAATLSSRPEGDHELSKLIWYLRFIVELGIDCGRANHGVSPFQSHEAHNIRNAD